MSFLLDTNICSAPLKRSAGLIHRFIPRMGRPAIPSIVPAELRAGADMRPDPAPLLARIEDLLVSLEVLDFDAACAEECGRLRGHPHRQGLNVAPLDLLIASVAPAPRIGRPREGIPGGPAGHGH